MKFRFQIVASAFHKGRLKITYDPSYPLTNEYNTNYTYIIDLAKERDFTVAVGWGHEQSMINHRNPVYELYPPYQGGQQITSPPDNFANGILSVYVVNDLTVPNSTADNDIEVNVFVSAGDDFEVFDPDSQDIQNLVWFRPQIGEIFSSQMAEIADQPMNQPDADFTKREDEPMKGEPSQILAPTLSDQDHTSCVYYGDPITSFRQCLKRYNYHSSIVPSTKTSAPTMMNLRNSDFPYYRGYAPGAVHEAVPPTGGIRPYNYCKMTLLNYITPAFSSRRGGLRWKYFRTGGRHQPETSYMMVARDATSTGGYAQNETSMALLDETNHFECVRQNEVLIPPTWDGAFVTSTLHNPTVEAEIPYYMGTRFSPAKQADLTSDPFRFRKYHLLSTIWTFFNTDASAIHCFVSVGEDFNLGFFTGAPVAYRAYYNAEPPAFLL